MVRKPKWITACIVVLFSVLSNGCITLPMSQKVNGDIDSAYATQMAVLFLSLQYRQIHSHWPKSIKDFKSSTWLISSTDTNDIKATFPFDQNAKKPYPYSEKPHPLRDLKFPLGDYLFSWDKDSNLTITYRNKELDDKDFKFSPGKNTILKITFQNPELGIEVSLEVDPEGKLVGIGGRDPRGLLK